MKHLDLSVPKHVLLQLLEDELHQRRSLRRRFQEVPDERDYLELEERQLHELIEQVAAMEDAVLVRLSLLSAFTAETYHKLPEVFREGLC